MIHWALQNLSVEHIQPLSMFIMFATRFSSYIYNAIKYFVCILFSAWLRFVLHIRIAMSQTCMFIAYRKFFDTRHSLIGRDHVDIDKFKLVQLQRRVQRDGYNCGVLCLKVCMHVTNLYLMHVLITLSCIDDRATT